MKKALRFWKRTKIFISIFSFVLLLVAVLYLAYSWQFSSSGLYRNEYEGRVIDKSITFAESQFGSGLRRRLLIEDRNGRQFEIAVKPDVYERAKIGMTIKNGNLEDALSSPR